MKRICVITGTRAEYGLLRWVMNEIRASSELELQIIATGSHLSPTFGLTYREIEQDRFVINKKIEILLNSDTSSGTVKSTGLALIGFADAFEELKPDLVLILGDRFEALAAASAALISNVPIGHIHGGEVTTGAFDDGIRHAITKFAALHFVATESSRRRVIQLGEHPSRVFLVGGLGVDALRRTKLLDRQNIEEALNFRLGPQNLLITWHPETHDPKSTDLHFQELIEALAFFEEAHVIFTLPNADPGSHSIISKIQHFVAQNPKSRAAFTNLGQQRYWSLMNNVNAVIGNSSSGLLEAPSLRVGTVDIGTRQAGRDRAVSVLHVAPIRQEIQTAIMSVLSPQFATILANTTNPYGDGGATDRIITILREWSQTEVHHHKPFFDLQQGYF